jgi:hypothetical protein
VWRGTRAFFLAAAAALVLGGCGDDSDPTAPEPGAEPDAIGLIRVLPGDAQGYSTADLLALEEGLDLASSADPYSDRELTPFTNATLGGVYAGHPEEAVVDALELPSATALASTAGGDGAPVTAVAISSGTAEIREALLDLGFVDRGGVLEGPDGARATHERLRGTFEIVEAGEAISSERLPPGDDATAVRFVEDGFLVSDDGDLLRSLGSEADELPLQVQSSLQGDATHSLLVGGGDGCILEQGIATSADGSGELVFLLDQDPDPSRFSSLDSAGFGEPAVDGDRLVIPIDVDAPESPADLLSRTLPGYDCSS